MQTGDTFGCKEGPFAKLSPDSLRALTSHLMTGTDGTVLSPFQQDDCMFSRALTLDLSQYPETEGRESSRRQREPR